MKNDFFYSTAEGPLDWPSAQPLLPTYGPKGAFLTVLPRLWTPPFVLIPAPFLNRSVSNPFDDLPPSEVDALWEFCESWPRLILRSSIIGETIWERGSYHSAILPQLEKESFLAQLWLAAEAVKASASGKQVALVLQDYRRAQFRGEFGNLLRISKTRDHWEVSSLSDDSNVHRTSLNTQRDMAADPGKPLSGHISPGSVRSFGSIAAWINNELLLGVSSRVNCEWVFDGSQVLLVQLDEEGPDDGGVNPLQVRIPPMIAPLDREGRYLRRPSYDELKFWDKLIVIDQLSTEDADVKPTLFFAPVQDLAEAQNDEVEQTLAEDFGNQIGPNEIIIRTSIRSGRTKELNLPKTEGLTPSEAARWCLDQLRTIQASGRDPRDYAFVAHRFMASRASAWVRCDPEDASVEIHVNWGLADALQYYSHDTVDVHIPTKNVSYYPDYKSHSVMPQGDGSWRHVRIKNEIARSQCVSRAEALEIAEKSLEICRGLNRRCHIMWFIGCTYENGMRFSLPWYWTEAHDRTINPDRIPPKAIKVRNSVELSMARDKLREARHAAIDLCPVDLDLMRDQTFLREVARVSTACNAPVILAGSPLAHAYYLLQKHGCSVICSGERSHTRVRNTVPMGKLVRDKIPERIKRSMEQGATKTVPQSQLKRLLVGKLVEEALEIREAVSTSERLEELADAFEIIRTLATNSGSTVEEIILTADKKRDRVGGFQDGVFLVETSIGERKAESPTSQVLPRLTEAGTISLPLTAFGFMEISKPVTIFLEERMMWLVLTLERDRLVIEARQDSYQLKLDLS